MMVNRFPYEVLSTIGIFLNQESQKNCALVCKSGRRPFQTLVFQKVVFSTQEQVHGFLEQDASFKELTRSLHFKIKITDQLFQSIAGQCPKVNTLMFADRVINFSDFLDNNFSLSENVRIIKKQWLQHLVKIRMDDILLPEVLPLISHQVQDVTGGYIAFFDQENQLISIPQLQEMNIFGDYYDEDDLNVLDITELERMRLAYPKLKKLTLQFFDIHYVTETPKYTPFPFVRSFHLIYCDDKHELASEQIKLMCTNLFELSHLRGVEANFALKQDFHTSLSKHPNLRQLAMPYHSGNMNFSVL